MVPDYLPIASFGARVFQYSLCRVVLMVRSNAIQSFFRRASFSTRSVESF